MATQTSNLGLTKPAYSETADIDVINNNMDKVDVAVNGVQNGMAILANGNTHAAVASGQFVYVRNHSTLADGLYKATAAIATNGTLSTSKLTAAPSNGVLNTLQDDVTALNSDIAPYNIGTSITSQTTLESALTAFGNSMSNRKTRSIEFDVGSGGAGVLPQQGYMGTMNRFTSDRYSVLVRSYGNASDVYTANYRNGVWTWDSLAQNSKFGVFGSSAAPITDLNDLPMCGSGYVVLAASISPTGSQANFSFTKQGIKSSNRYTVTVTQIKSSENGGTYVGNVYNGTFIGWEQLASNSKFATIEDKQITQIGNYIVERSAFKARRVGQVVQIYSYVNVTTQVPKGTDFADTGFSNAEGTLLFVEEDGSKATVVTCSQGRLRPNVDLQIGYYYAVGSMLSPR